MMLSAERMAALRAAVLNPRASAAPAPDIDVLDDVLAMLDGAATIGGREERPAAPWRVASLDGDVRGATGDADNADDLHLLILERGEARLRLGGDGQSDGVALAPGEIALAPGDVVLARGAYELSGAGGGTALVRGTVRFRNAAARGWLDPLPPLVRVAASRDGHASPLDGLSSLILAEAADPGPGRETVRTRLAEALWVHVLRAWIAGLARGDGGWLGALRDPKIGGALALMHADPAHAWTVALLAARVRMTRSPFAARFTALVGEPPLTYLTRWRLQLAMRALAGDRRTLRDIAARVGYESEAAFSKVFRRHVGVAPGAYRKAAGARPRAPEVVRR
jgi:AraC-like DNA-binding protein